MAMVCSLVPANADEANIAAMVVSALAQAEDCARLARSTGRIQCLMLRLAGDNVQSGRLRSPRGSHHPDRRSRSQSWCAVPWPADASSVGGCEACRWWCLSGFAPSASSRRISRYTAAVRSCGRSEDQSLAE
jgi:hypothetical protein